MREHRLYQADWLMRFYGFTHDEIVPPSQVGMLALDMDPKLAWALAHRERFPVNLNTAPRELLLRVPGFGVQTVDRLLAAAACAACGMPTWRGCMCRSRRCCRLWRRRLPPRPCFGGC